MMTCILLKQGWISLSHAHTNTCTHIHSRLLAADTPCLWLLLCYHFSPLCPWPQSHMRAISVELPLAKNDFMSDLLETEREGGGCITVCMGNILHKTGCFDCSVDYCCWFRFDALEVRLCECCTSSPTFLMVLSAFGLPALPHSSIPSHHNTEFSLHL